MALLPRRPTSTITGIGFYQILVGEAASADMDFQNTGTYTTFPSFLLLYINILCIFRRKMLFCITEALKPRCVTNF
jgi:hypothetical protein